MAKVIFNRNNFCLTENEDGTYTYRYGEDSFVTIEQLESRAFVMYYMGNREAEHDREFPSLDEVLLYAEAKLKE